MTADILTNIHNKLTTFSKGQRRIATYILESYDKAAFLTAGALGKITQVSESTVVRFAAELGYDGYPAMQRALQEMVLNRLTSVQRIEVTDERLGRAGCRLDDPAGGYGPAAPYKRASRPRGLLRRGGGPAAGALHLCARRPLLCGSRELPELLPALYV